MCLSNACFDVHASSVGLSYLAYENTNLTVCTSAMLRGRAIGDLRGLVLVKLGLCQIRWGGGGRGQRSRERYTRKGQDMKSGR